MVESSNCTPTTLGQFLSLKLAQENLSMRAAASGMGFSATFLSAVIRGKRKPGIDTINQIADYFQVPRTYLYELMGWIDLATSQKTTQDDMAFLKQLAESDEEFVDIARTYASMSTEERMQFIRVMRAYKEK